ncbi:MAG TPA: Gfo/Idh/MocA family oxidoreductase [Acidimicrobiales bacterium]|nr:Gfo/Idh/MocA family oxidoreductase [Acidimicrobiales bacterium]
MSEQEILPGDGNSDGSLNDLVARRFTPLGPGPVGFGLVGCGVIADVYAQAFAAVEDARLVVAHDVEGERAQAYAERNGAEVAASLEDLLGRDDVRAVIVCVPSGLHADVAVAAARAGKHLVVEKPIDIHLDAARRLMDEAARAGVSLNIVSQQRYNPGVQAARRLLEEDRLGDVLFVQARVPWYRSPEYYASGEWRGTWALDGGGAFMNQGVHYADLVCWLFGQPDVISAHCANLDHQIEVEDLALATFRLPGETLGTLMTSTLSYPGFSTVLSVNGTQGSLELTDGALSGLELRGGTDGLDLGDTGSLGMPGGHIAQLADMVRALQEGAPPPVNGEDGYRALRFVLDVYRQAGWRY